MSIDHIDELELVRQRRPIAPLQGIGEPLGSRRSLKSSRLRLASRNMNDFSTNSTTNAICSADSRAAAARLAASAPSISAAILSRHTGSVISEFRRHDSRRRDRVRLDACRDVGHLRRLCQSDRGIGATHLGFHRLQARIVRQRKGQQPIRGQIEWRRLELGRHGRHGVGLVQAQGRLELLPGARLRESFRFLMVVASRSCSICARSTSCNVTLPASFCARAICLQVRE